MATMKRAFLTGLSCLQVLLVILMALFSPLSFARTATAEDVKAIARIYSAAFDREPQIDGLNFWVVTREGGTTLIQIAKRFYESPEFTEKYGQLSNEDYVRQLFRNVLGREGAESGIEYWVGHLDNGVSRARILLIVGTRATSPLIVFRRR